MTKTTITIEVDSDTARAFGAAPVEAQRKIQLLLNLRLRDLTVAGRKPLRTVMDEIGERAEERGLTPVILENLLESD